MTSSSDPRPQGLSMYTRFIVRPDGDDENGGGYSVFYGGDVGVDRSDSSTAHVVFDGSAITGTKSSSNTLIIGGSTGYTVSTADEGNVVFMYFATSGYYCSGTISTVNTSANSWTFGSSVFNNVGTSEAMTSGRMGGALASLGESSARMSSYSSAFVKTGTTYTLTSSSLCSASNCGTSEGPFLNQYDGIVVCAYHTTPGDYHTDPNTRAIIDSGSTTTTSVPMVKSNTDHGTNFIGLELRGNDDWDDGGNYGYYTSCVAKEFNTQGFAFQKSATSCYADGCGYGCRSGAAIESLAIDCTDGYRICTAFRCAAVSCSGYGFLEYARQFSGVSYCAAHDCGTGFHSDGDWRGSQIGNVASSCTRGCSYNNMQSGMAFYNCTENEKSGHGANQRYGTRYGTQLTQQPFNDPDNGDFTLNDTAGGGAELTATLPNWASRSIAGPQQQQSPLLESSSGGASVIPARPIQIGA